MKKRKGEEGNERREREVVSPFGIETGSVENQIKLGRKFLDLDRLSLCVDTTIRNKSGILVCRVHLELLMGRYMV